MPTTASPASSWAGVFTSRGVRVTTALTGATGATKWDANSKVATHVVTATTDYPYTPSTATASDDSSDTSSTSNSSTTAPKPELTVVSGLQFVQVSTLSPTVIGT
jgi:hypothetical protein